MSDLLTLLVIVTIAFVALGGVTVNGTHYHVGHEDGTGITWNEDKVTP